MGTRRQSGIHGTSTVRVLLPPQSCDVSVVIFVVWLSAKITVMCVRSCELSYDSSLTDGQWAVIEALLPERDPRPVGRPLKFPRQLVVDTVLYVLVSGCAWRLVPHDLAPWDAAYPWFRAWRGNGTWGRVHDTLRERVRTADGRDPQPPAAVLDSQSARSHQGSEAMGYDTGKPPACFAPACSASDASASRSWERLFCTRRIAASRVRKRTTRRNSAPSPASPARAAR